MDFPQLLQKLRNPFIKLTDEEKFVLKQKESEVKKDIKEFSGVAKELFGDARYKKLKDLFKDIYEQNMQLIIYFDCDDTQKYIMKMREYQMQLRTLKSIFDTPEDFIKKEEEIKK